MGSDSSATRWSPLDSATTDHSRNGPDAPSRRRANMRPRSLVRECAFSRRIRCGKFSVFESRTIRVGSEKWNDSHIRWEWDRSEGRLFRCRVIFTRPVKGHFHDSECRAVAAGTCCSLRFRRCSAFGERTPRPSSLSEFGTTRIRAPAEYSRRHSPISGRLCCAGYLKPPGRIAYNLPELVSGGCVPPGGGTGRDPERSGRPPLPSGTPGAGSFLPRRAGRRTDPKGPP